MSKPIFGHASILIVCIIVIANWATNFPYPSPLIKHLLPPEKRYPSRQIAEWVESGAFPTDFLEYFARDPDRIVPTGNNIVSPADGFIREMHSENGINYLMIQLTFWDVHVIRSPIAGRVTKIEEEGITLFRKDPKDLMMLRGKVAPVQKILTLETDIGEVKLRMITNYWASRVKTWVAHGETLQKGQRVGRMIAGSTVVAEFPNTVTFDLETKQRVIGGESIIFSKENRYESQF